MEKGTLVTIDKPGDWFDGRDAEVMYHEGRFIRVKLLGTHPQVTHSVLMEAYELDVKEQDNVSHDHTPEAR